MTRESELTRSNSVLAEKAILLYHTFFTPLGRLRSDQEFSKREHGQ